MKEIFFTLSLLLSLQAVRAQPLNIGEGHILHSRLLNEDRRLNIYLPEGDNKGNAYPVLYLLDGSMNEDFLHIVGLVQFFHMTFQMPDMLVVGIANIDRKRDFTFWPTDTSFTRDYPTTGHSEIFMRFLEEELIPFIEQTYQTTDKRIIIGQSLGGLLATEILLKKPQLFSDYCVVSPSLWWDNEDLLQTADSLLALNKKQGRKNIYLAFGADEERIMRKDARELANKIRGAEMDVVTNEMKGEDHATILHNAVYQAFLNWFGNGDDKGQE